MCIKSIEINDRRGRIERIEEFIRKLFVRWLRHRISKEINRQRLKLIWNMWGYWSLFSIKTLSFLDKLILIVKFLVIDWNVLHAHKPREISVVCCSLADRFAYPGEVLLEAGCWRGGSSAKFSLICSKLGYRLCIYDSFKGVEQMYNGEEEGQGYDFSGEYVASEDTLKENVARYGNIDLCSIYKGWFTHTLATGPVPYNVRVAFIDCDLAKGTKEALLGIVPSLVEDGWIFSQDFHIRPVQQVLCDPTTWRHFGKDVPTITRVGHCLAYLQWKRE